MSESRLNIGITAKDTASAQIKALEGQLRSLQGGVNQLNAMQARANAVASASMQKEIDLSRAKIASITTEINALRTLIGVKDQATAATIRGGQAATAAARETEVGLRRMLASANQLEDGLIAAYNRAPAASKAAIDAQVAYTNSKWAEMEAAQARFASRNVGQTLTGRQFFDSALRDNPQIRPRRPDNRAKGAFSAFEGSGLLGASANDIAAAHYENQVHTAIAAKQRLEANYENANRELAAKRIRADAEYENSVRSASASHSRSQAEYENRDQDLIAAKLRREAEYENAARTAAAQRMRAEAEYINQGRTANSIRQRQEAEYENNTRETLGRRLRQEAEVENATRTAASQHTRSQAEYINRDQDLAYARQRAEAEYMNRDFDLRARRSRQSSDGGRTINVNQEARHAMSVVDSLASGHRGQAFASIGAAARDAGLGVGGLTASMSVLVALMAGGAILRSAQHMGEWATKTHAAASAAGMSLQAYSALQGALALTGIKADSADQTLRHLSTNLSTALEQPTSKAAEAFRVLGISQETLAKNGQSTEGVLRLLAAAYVRTADGANKSAAMSELFGRDFEKIIPLLEKGATGLDTMTAEAKRLGITLDESAEHKLRAAGDAVTHLSEVMRGEGIKAMIAWSETIQSAAAMLEKLVGWAGKAAQILPHITGVALGGPLLLNELRERNSGSNSKGDGTAGSPVGGTGKDPVAAMIPSSMRVGLLEQMHEQIAQARLQAANKGGSSKQMAENELKAEIGVMREYLTSRVQGAKQISDLSKDLANKETELRNMTAREGESTAKQTYADFAAAEKLKIAEAHGSSTAIAAIYDEWINAANTKYHEHLSVVRQIEKEKVNAVRAARLEETRDQFKDAEQTARLGHLNTELGALQSGTAKTAGEHVGPSMNLKRAQELVAEAQEVDATYKRQADALRAYGATAQEIVAIEIQAKTTEVELYKRAAAEVQAATNKLIEPFVKMFDSIGSHLDAFTSSAISALIAPQMTLEKRGLTTIKHSEQGNALRSAFQSAIVGIASDFGKSMKEAVGHILANALSGGASNTIGQLLGNWLGKAASSLFPSLAGSLGGQAAGSAVSGTAVVTAVSTGAATTVTGISTAVAANATAIGSAIAASTTAIVAAIGSAAAAEDTLLATLNLKPSILGTTYAHGGIVPSAAGGMIVGGVNGAQLAVLHAREMVLPEHLSRGIQNMINGGNSANLSYSPTINTGSRSRGGTGMTRSEFSQMLSTHSGAFLGEARNMFKNGWRPA